MKIRIRQEPEKYVVNDDVKKLTKQETLKIHAFSRSNISFNDTRIIHHFIDIEYEYSIEKAAISIPNNEYLD